MSPKVIEPDATMRGRIQRADAARVLCRCIDLILRSTIHCWWVDSPEAILKDVAHYVEYLLELQSCQRESTTKEDGKWTELDKRTKKRPRGKGRQRHVMAFQKTIPRPFQARMTLRYQGDGH